jgi:DNA-binding MarR family transcriptional regulator
VKDLAGGDVDGGRESSIAPGGPVPGHSPQAVGFLLAQLGFETANRFGKLMAEVDLEPRQFAVMRAIEAFDGQSQNAVGEQLRIPASSMVALVDHLEGRGLVERRAHPKDRRSRTLHMTDHGKGVLERATVLAMGLEQTICRDIDPGAREDLIEKLVRVADNLGLVQGLHPGVSTDHQSSH